MASHQGGPSPLITSSDARDGSDLATDTAESTASPWPIPERCQWRTPQFHDQECHRFLDCPSHHVARTSPAEAMEPGEDDDDLIMGSSVDTFRTLAPSRFDGVRSSRRTRISSTGRHPLDDLPGTVGTSPDTTTTTNNTTSARPSPQSAITMEANSRARPARFYPTPPLRSSSMTNRFHQLPHHGRISQGASADSGDGSDWGRNSSTSSNRAIAGSPPRRESSRGSPEGLSLMQALERLSLGGARLEGDRSSRRYVVGASGNDGAGSTEVVLPRWQPDAEVTYCPICQAQFNIFVRKHHCRKCGRVVCNSCSPHRIIIPHQFIVRPPGAEVPLPQSLLLDALNGGFLGADGLSGGERVRLCNPCVPDPNTAPPQSPTTAAATAAAAAAASATVSPPSHRSTRHRSRSTFGGLASMSGQVPAPASRYSDFFSAGQGSEQYQQLYASPSRNIMVDPATSRPGPSSSSLRRRTTANYHSSLDQLLAVGPSSSSLGALNYGNHRHMGAEASSSRQRALPLRSQIAEEDECPICHLELPSRSLPNFENLREVHITDCILSHSAYGSPRPGAAGGNTPPAAPRRTGMYTYSATEKDCVDDAECTICLEEFVVGVPMARLECLCRFHRACISAWFVNHPGRCPVHQHDGFGY